MCDDFAPSLVAALGQAIFGVSNVEQTRMRTDLLHQTSSECRVGQNHLLNKYLAFYFQCSPEVEITSPTNHLKS